MKITIPTKRIKVRTIITSLGIFVRSQFIFHLFTIRTGIEPRTIFNNYSTKWFLVVLWHELMYGPWRHENESKNCFQSDACADSPSRAQVEIFNGEGRVLRRPRVIVIWDYGLLHPSQRQVAQDDSLQCTTPIHTVVLNRGDGVIEWGGHRQGHSYGRLISYGWED